MNINDLATRQNLLLAWRRITTGGNQQYKRLFRQVYLAYEIVLDRNLADLRQRLLGGSFVPRRPDRIYLPKQSGLHRPLSLLHVEDQVVLQAIANVAAKRVLSRRVQLQFRSIFSNILQRSDSIFFFQRWQETYAVFQTKIGNLFESGMTWVGDFDLAAFYDTISHELLLRTIFPRTADAAHEFVFRCLRTWSSDRADSGHGHGLPQGPLASDFLAECFLLPIDMALKSRRGYVRYVDDVRLFGRTEDEVRAALITLERHCRERGLIPQIGKFAIKRAASVAEAMGMLPSISDPQHPDGSSERLPGAKALRLFKSAIGGRPSRVVDRTRLRYLLYRAEPDSQLLKLVLRLIPHHPEHADAFFTYLGRFTYRKGVERTCLNLIDNSPYSYLRGEAWHVLARDCRERRSYAATNARRLSGRAISVARSLNPGLFNERWGACHFLCVAETVTGTHVSRFLKRQSPLLQALLAPALPDSAYRSNEAAEAFLRAKFPEPGLSVCAELQMRNVNPIREYGINSAELASQVVNTLKELGLVAAPRRAVDPIDDILHRRYGLARGTQWRRLFNNQYVHALGLLKQAEAAFLAAPSWWLACQNSFNDAAFRSLQVHLSAVAHQAACTTTNKLGQLIDFGVMLDANGPFSAHCPTLASCFRDINSRRNSLPVAHPYEKKTAAPTRHLKAAERTRFVTRLRAAYRDFSRLMP